MTERLFRVVLTTFVVLWVLCGGMAASAAVLKVGSFQTEEGGIVTIPVTLDREGGAFPATVAFAIGHGVAPIEVVNVLPGSAATAAGKSVEFNIHDTGVQVLVGGVNTGTLDNGVVASLLIDIGTPESAFKTFPLTGISGSAATFDAASIALTIAGGAITTNSNELPVLGTGTLVGLLLLACFLALRRLRRCSMALVMAALFLCAPARAQVAGDVDGSGVVDASDLAEVASVLLGGTSAYNTNVNLDGRTDAVDYQLLVRVLLGHDIDADDDGLTDDAEVRIGTNPNNPDTDGDGLGDYEEHFGETSATDPDSDNDGLNDGEEQTRGTDPLDPDSDDDGLPDGDEVHQYNTDPLNQDSDGDGLDDSREIHETITDPADSDSDDDGLSDGAEIETHRTDPNAGDTDGDGLSDPDEINTYNTDPTNSDSDGDGTNDGDEIANGTDPNTLDADLVITEFMADNASGLQDEDGGYSDWIEIHNPSSVSANLAGWTLTDSVNNLQLWTFPAVSIPAGGYLVVFASGLDRTPTDGSNLHTSFALSRDGEFLALVKPGGQVEHAYAPVFPSQTEDVSYGLYNGEKHYFTTPTPGAPNTLGVLGFVEPPQYSVPHGLYSAPFQLTLTTPTPGASIRYTLDGSTPTPANGTLFDVAVPITVSGNAVFRAVAYKTGYVDSEVAAHSYIFLADVLSQPVLPAGFPATWGGAGSSNQLIDGDYEMDPDILNDPAYSGSLDAAMNSLPIMSVSLPVADLFSATTGIISNSARNDQVGWTRACSAEMFMPDGTSVFNVNCGIRVVGGASTNSNFNSMKHSFRLKFQPEYGPSRLRLDNPMLPGTPLTSFNTWTIDARYNHTWHHRWSAEQRGRAQYLRDVIMNDLQIALDEVSPHGRYVHFFLNGLYWGMYWIHERPDESFLADYWGGQKEDYDVIKHTRTDVMSGTNQRYDAMFALARSGLADSGTYDALISQYLQIDPFINYMLLNLWAGNDDWDHHNWYVGANRVEGTGFQFYSWDAEHTFKDHPFDTTGENNAGAPSELHQLLLQNEEYRVAFGDRAHKLLLNGGLFTNATVSPYWDNRVNEIYLALIFESARWGDNSFNRGNDTRIFTRDVHWAAEQDRLRNTYLPQRAGIVLNQLRNRGAYPSVDAPTYNIGGVYQHGGVIASGAVLTMANPNGAGTIYYTLDGTDPRGPSTPGEIYTLLTEAAPKRVLVPTGDIGTGWRTQIGYDDTAWTPGTDGVGYERSTGYDAYIGIDVETEMYNINGSCYIRIPFSVDAGTLASLQSLTLNVRYDDGFALYLNGVDTPLATGNAPGTMVWNSVATTTHSDSLAVNFVSYDVTAALGTLQAGPNFFAVQEMNNNTTSSDLLFSVELVGSTAPATSGVSATAIDYGTNPPAPLTDTTRVLARVLENGEWSALNDAVFRLDTSDYGALRITELMYRPKDPDPASYYNDEDFEFIEVKNTGPVTLDLSGVRLDDGVYFGFNDSTIREPHLLAPGEYVVVAKSPNAFRERYGEGIYVIGPYLGSLNNNGERVVMNDPAGLPIVQFTFNNAWFQVTDGLGFSLTARDETLDALGWDTKDAWRPSSVDGGTPGTGDTPTVPDPGAVVINEVLSHSHAGAPDWIELYNTTNTAINLEGWFLSDDNLNLMKYVFPAGVVLPAQGYLVVYEDLHFGAGNPDVPFALSENGDTVYLSSGFNGALTGYSEEESFGASETGVAFGRYFKASTGTYNFVPMSANTPGAANAAPLVGPIVITEIMYHPQDLPAGNPDAEFIELLNISGAPVTLEDPATGATWAMTAGVDFVFPAGTTLSAGGRALLVLNATVFNATYPGVTAPVFQWTSGRLDNAGETVELGKPGDVDGAGNRQYIRVDRVNYDDLAPWPATPDGAGDALHRTVPDAYGNDVANWTAAAPTPGN